MLVRVIRISSVLVVTCHTAIKFMWSCCYESLVRMKTEPGSGCILAHCMGLGKTLSVRSKYFYYSLFITSAVLF